LIALPLLLGTGAALFLSGIAEGAANRGIPIAASVVFDTGTLQVTRNGAPYDFGGQLAGAVLDGDTARFLFPGDLDIGPDMVIGRGPNLLAIVVGNDVNIDPDAVLDFSATTAAPGPGGGSGGGGGTGGAGGNGGETSQGGAGGGGGAGAVGNIVIPGVLCELQAGGQEGDDGDPGSSGDNGVNGTLGISGQTGSAGAGSPGSGGLGGARRPQAGSRGFAGAGGAEGVGNLGGASAGYTPIPGLPGVGVGNGQGGGTGGGAATLLDGNGSPGSSAPATGGSAGGVGSHAGAAPDLSAGGGGGGGGGGAGGGGGGSGGSGGGGGGGGGGGAACSFYSLTTFTGGSGGDGGDGGSGGQGGHGGNGGNGGAGGHGGGGAGILANGRVMIDTSPLRARGGNGAAPGGNTSHPQINGALGGLRGGGDGGGPSEGGGPVDEYVPLDFSSGPGGNGGPGGHTGGARGGNGGNGGTGSTGLPGAGGAGGAIKLVGSVVSASGAMIQTGGGATPAGAPGATGHFLFGNNVATGAPTMVIATTHDVGGSKDANPFVEGGTTQTPFIAGLPGGAEIYGLTGIAPADVDDVVSGAPAGAVAALTLLDVGPAPLSDDYTGFDMLLLTNLTGAPLNSGGPHLGAGSAGFLHPLLERGPANNPVFGGSGPVVMSELPAGGVYATLVPSGNTFFNASVEATCSVLTVSEELVPGDTVYLVDAPVAGDLDGDCDVDTADVSILLADRNLPVGSSACGAACDLDGDGVITALDARILVTMCTLPGCATE
jgi:hypothetical protein